MPNSLPFLSGFSTSITIGEEDANLTPQLIDNDVTFTDADNNFDGGTLLLSGLLPDDTISIRDQGSGAGEIGFSGGNVTFAGTIIGTVTGGAGASLSVTFNASATSASIERLIENLTFATLSDTPTAARTLELSITDAAGAKAVAPVTVTARTGAANPFNGIDVGNVGAPSLVDLDGDGDLDLVIGENDGILNYYENTGTGLAPAYTVRTGAANPFNGIDVGSRSAPNFADLDGDGDLDLVIGENDGVVNYYENTGTGLAPVYTVRTGAANPFNGIDIGSVSTPRFADLDGDGDLDLVIGEDDGTLNYYENTGTGLAPAYTVRTGAANPFNGIDVGFYSTPSLADLDGDGDLDLVIGEISATLHYYENTGTGLAPVYTARTGAANPFNGIDIGFASNPDFADLDGDGDLDLVIGENDGTLNYYENTGAGLTPAFTVRTGAANPFNGIDVGFYSTPSLADLDGDGDLDLVIGELGGNLHFYENTGTGLTPAYTVRTGAANPFNSIGIGLASTPSFADLDGDGDLDLVIGEQDGNLNYYENTGTGLAPVYTARTGAANPFNGIDIGTHSKPSFADLDGDGDLDLVIGENDGTLNYYENTGTGLAPVYTARTGAANPFNGIGVGFFGAPSLADLDADGDLDLVIGNYEGTLHYYENTGTGLAPVYTVRTGAANPFNGIDVSFKSNPDFADLDGDGDLDLVIGDYWGTLNYYENTGAGFRFVLNVTAFDDPASPRDDAFASLDTAPASGNVLADNGNGADSDPDSALAVTAVNGSAVSVGTQITLASGALLTLNANGTFNYDPNGRFEHLPLNAQATDSFTYEVNGVAATATVTITGIDNNDTINGTSGADTLWGGVGDDTIRGLGGNDVLVGGANNDTMLGGAGDDSYLVEDAGDVVTELVGEGTDIAYVFDMANYSLSANVEVGVAFGTTLNINGNSSDNTLIGNGQNNVLSGGDGDDTIYGIGGGNTLLGGANNDVLVSGTGADGMAGGTGNDTYIIGVDDIVNETAGEGIDTVYSSLDSYTLTANVEIGATVDAGRALYGNELDNTLIGNGNNNVLSGAGGSDYLVGGLGSDLLIGGSGLDTLQGEGGGDVFWWTAITDLGDIITDWANPEDQLQFSAGAFFNFAGGVLIDGLNFISSTTPGATTANATFLWDSDDTNLFFDADGNGAGGAVLVADFQAFTTLDVSDFQFV